MEDIPDGKDMLKEKVIKHRPKNIDSDVPDL